MNIQPLVETVDLKKYFKVSSGILHAVDGINLKIYPKKTLGVVGESGCGKSTLGRTIVNLLSPSGGDVLFKGKSVLRYNKKELRNMRKNMQFIFQDPYSSLDPRLTVSASISEFMRISKLYSTNEDFDVHTDELMETVGLAKRFRDLYPHELDGGRRQRVGIARALSVNPEFIICDEPVSALDVSIQAQILNLLMDLQDTIGLTYMFITHDLSVVKHISNDIMVMYLGQCVELAPTDELFNNPQHPYTKALLDAVPIPDISMRYKKIEFIKGEITSPISPKPGCRFAARCKYASSKCTKKNIQLKDIGGGHFVSCTLIE